MFLATDVANRIDHSRTSQMLNTVDSEEKLQCNIVTGKHETKRTAWFLTEDGLYEVLMQSYF